MAEDEKTGTVRVLLPGGAMEIVEGVSKMVWRTGLVTLYAPAEDYYQPQTKAILGAIGFVVESGKVEIEFQP